jgi:hypothetical protein
MSFVSSERHAKAESLDHVVVPQACKARATVLVKLYNPKLNPVIETLAPPVRGTFRTACDVTGASNVKSGPSPVPTTAATDTAPPTSPLDGPEKHERLVRVVQDVEWQKICDTDAVIEKSERPKLSPTTLTTAPPVCGVLRSPADATGASKLKVPEDVPTRLLSVTTLLGMLT